MTTLDETLQDLPPYYESDPFSRTVLTALLAELARVEAALDAIRTGLAPQNADDTYGTLGMWERLLNLPVEPVGVTLAERQLKVLGNLRKRKSGRGSDWVETLNTAIGSTTWTHKENSPFAYQLTIHIPAGTVYTSGQIQALAAKITPAHIEIIFDFEDAFLFGISPFGTGVF